MSNCIIIHGCPSSPEDNVIADDTHHTKHWMQWTAQQLREAGIPTETPVMPEPWSPNYERFAAAFEKQEINEDTILIGHSYGCAFLVRWLGETNKRIKKLILVAPWKVARLGDEGREAFYNYPIDEIIKDHVDEIMLFTSDNEEEEGKQSLQMFHNALGGEIVLLPSHGHYTLEDMGSVEFPELVEVVLR